MKQRIKRTTKTQVFEILGNSEPVTSLAGRLGMAESTVFAVLAGSQCKGFYREYVELHGQPKPRPPRKWMPDILYVQQTPLNLPWGRATRPAQIFVGGVL